MEGLILVGFPTLVQLRTRSREVAVVLEILLETHPRILAVIPETVELLF